MIPFDLHYQWPSAAYLILLIFPAIFCFWLLFAYRQKISFIKEMILRRSPGIFWTKAALFVGAMIFCVIALMQPVGNGHYPEGVVPNKASKYTEDQPIQLKRKAHDLIFLVDASASMQVPDTRLQQSRLDYAKIIADEIIASLNGETVALYAFTSDISRLAPLTLDYLFTRLMVKEIQINEGGIPGTDMSNLLQKMQATYFPEGAVENSRLKTFILLSDGEDTTLEFYPDAMKNQGMHDLAKYLQNAAQNHLRLYTIGMGSAAGGVVPGIKNQQEPVVSHLNADLLKLLANTGRGQYYEANLYTPAELVKDLLNNMAQDLPYYEEKPETINSALIQALFGKNTLLYDRYFQVPVALALLCLAFILLFPDTVRAWARTAPLLLMFCMMEIKGQEMIDSSEIYHARAYAEAKMYDQARSIYERLLQRPISEQQKSALQYNLGVLYLEEGSWDQAIHQFNELEANKALQEYLYKRLYTNLMLAQYEKGLAFSKSDPIEALKLLLEALKTSENLPEKEQTKFGMVIKQKMLSLYEESAKEKLLKEDAIERIQILYDGTSDALEALDLIDKQKMTEQLKKEYTAILTEQQGQWIPLWNINEASPLFDDAKNSYRELINATKNGQIEKAIEAGKVSRATLASLMDLLAKNSLLKEKLRQLINAYQRLLAKKSWKNHPWEGLQQLFESIEKVDGFKAISFEIERSQQELSQAIEIFQKGNFSNAQILAQDALQWIKVASAKTFPTTSQNILETMIQQEEYLMRLVGHVLEKKSDQVTSLLADGQSVFDTLEDLFFSTLYQEQVEAYSKQGNCQATPWGEALPLVTAGNQAAAVAEKLLADAGTSIDQKLVQVKLQQQSAVDYWQKALSEIKHPTSQSSSCLGGGAGDEASNASLTTLLQMETQDKFPVAPTTTRQNVLHPW